MIDAFLRAITNENSGAALAILGEHPSIPSLSLHAAAALGRPDDVARLIANDPAQVSRRAGDPSAEPLLFACFSPLHGESEDRDRGLVESVRHLLAAGADPNTKDGRYGVAALYGVTGRRSVLPVARMLLDAGANPTDGESVFHAAERFGEDALELLWERGVQLNHTGEWGNTPLYFLLRYYDVAAHDAVRKGFHWLLAHGADPNVACGKDRETSLQVAVRRGQGAAIVSSLLAHGGDVQRRSGDGASPWLLASRGGHDDLVALLEAAGATPEPLSPTDLLLAACGRGDSDRAREIASPALIAALPVSELRLLPDWASARRSPSVLACIAAGFPIDTLDSNGATALHHAAIHGLADAMRALLAAGADFTIRDPDHNSTPFGWATFGSDFVADADGDYVGCVRALMAAGAQLPADEHQPMNPAVLEALER